VTNTGGTSLLTLNYGYCPGTPPGPAQCTSNNGNVRSATIVEPGQSVNVAQTFGYDGLNRLTSAGETPQSGSNTTAWSQTYGYDAYGNRWVSANSGVPLSPFTPIVSTNFDSNNRLQIGTTSYDLSGNQTVIGGYTSTFDGENRLKTSTLNSITTSYIYDGSGQRVQKAVGGGLTTTYVYDAAGDLTSEFVSGTPPTNPCTTCYVVSDTLGSTRLMMDAGSGNIVALHDYLPFGEEISGSPVRPGTLYGGTDNPRQKFTGKERDTETGNDFFGARYFSGAQGRFISADPIAILRSRLVDPQRLNLYSYVRNNPLQFVDSDGKDLHVIVTNTQVGSSRVNRYTSDEMRANPNLRQYTEAAPTYRVRMVNDSRSLQNTEVTRDSVRNGTVSQTRGHYGTGNEAPPGTYSGKTRDSGSLGFRMSLSDNDNPGSYTISGPEGSRIGIAIHIGPGASEGCMLLTGGAAGRDAFQEQIQELLNEDKLSGLGTDITVIIVERYVEPVEVPLASELVLDPLPEPAPKTPSGQ
jgi:RHS repeat-associated protein